MLTLSDPLAAVSSDGVLLSADVRAVLALRLAQLSEMLAEFALGELVTFHAAEPGDTLDSLTSRTGLPIARSWYDDAAYGTPDYAPAWDQLECHDGQAGCVFEMVFVLSDSGYAEVLLVPDQPDIDDTLRQLCRTYATPTHAAFVVGEGEADLGFPEPLDPEIAPALAGLTPAQREHFEERAGILEHDAGEPRREAERRALAEVLARVGQPEEAVRSSGA